MTFILLLLKLILVCIIFLVSYKYIIPKKFTGFNYIFKSFWSQIRINNIKKTQGNIDWVGNGWNLEQSTLINNSKNFDSLAFYAYDHNGNSLLTKISKTKTDITEIWLQIRLNNGHIYQLPEHPSTSINCKNNGKWSANGLDFVVLEPFKRLRVTFNGLLRNCSRDNCTTELGEVVHVKFHFMWSSCTMPKYWPLDQSTSLLYKAISQESWNNQSWSDVITNAPVYGYDQYGALYGELCISDETIELNLPTLRKRRMGLLDDLKEHIEVMGIFKDGTLYNIGVSSTKYLKNHRFGTIRTPCGEFFSLTDTDISMKNIDKINNEKLKVFIINFEADKQKYQLIVHLIHDDSSKIYGGNPWSMKYNVIPLECILNGNEYGYGLAVCGESYEGLCDVPLLTPKSYLTFIDNIQENDKLIVQFNERECQSVAIVGGKGASLGLLYASMNSEFTVPLGFCVTAKALKYQLEYHPDILALIDELTTKKNEIKLLETHCESVKNKIASISMCDNLSNIIKTSLEQLRIEANIPYDNKPLRFAARSSSLREDSEESSAAGQYDTILGCLTNEDILNAISQCWASLYSFRSVVYRIQHGQPINCEMGVVIQLMVPSEVAGVMFTCHSTTNDPSKILVTASYGLGESVVSSLVSPDEFIINRTWDNKLNVLSKTIGEKSILVVMTDNSTEKKNLPIEKSTRLCMTDEQVLRIVEIGIHLQTLYGHHCDIEWAFYRDTIYILQSRAITTINGITDFELLHEFDTALLTDNELITFSNVGEVMPMPMSTLGLNIISPYANQVSDSHKPSSYLKNLYKYYYISFPVYNHRLTLNILGKFLEDVDADKISITNRVISLAVTGKDIMTERLHKIAVHRYKPSLLKKLRSFWRIIVTLWINKKVIARAEKIEYTYRIHEAYDNYTDSKNLFEFIEKHHFIIGEIFQCHIDSSFASIFYKILSTTILMENNEEFTPEHLEDISVLLSLNNEALSADVPVKLEKIAQIILKSDKITDFQNLKSEDIYEWLKINIPNAFDKIECLLTEHGHRGIMEFDVASDPWILNPKPLLESLMVTTKLQHTRKVKQIDINDVLNNLKTPKRFLTKLLLRILLPKVSTAVRIREFTKSISILCFHRLRLGYRKLGKQLEEEGRLPNSQLINHLHPVEIRKLIFENETNLIQKAIKRQKLQDQWRQLTYDEFYHGRPRPIESNYDEMDMDEHDKQILISGTPVYPGIIKGRACVMKSVVDAHLIEPNDILITIATDIGWSPYFPMVSGIVTELGGLVSHGAVIAREYGIPCVIGAKDATKKINTGDQIILSATNGKIIRPK